MNAKSIAMKRKPIISETEQAAEESARNWARSRTRRGPAPRGDKAGTKGRAGKKASGKTPILQHPFFPLIVGLWIAALVLAATFVIPVYKLGRMVTSMGIDDIISAARPPLGMTARFVIGAALGSIAGMAGLIGTWLLAKRSRAKSAASVSDKAAQRGKSAKPRPSVLDFDDLHDLPSATRNAKHVEEDAVPPPARRRPLAIDEHQDRDGPAPFITVAPLPGDYDAPAVAPAAAVSAQSEAPAPVEADTPESPVAGYTSSEAMRPDRAPQEDDLLELGEADLASAWDDIPSGPEIIAEARDDADDSIAANFQPGAFAATAGPRAFDAPVTAPVQDDIAWTPAAEVPPLPAEVEAATQRSFAPPSDPFAPAIDAAETDNWGAAAQPVADAADAPVSIAEPEASYAPEPEPAPQPAFEPAYEAFPQPVPAAASVAAEMADEDAIAIDDLEVLDSNLSLAQLVQRLGVAITVRHRRLERQSDAGAQPVQQQPAPQPFAPSIATKIPVAFEPEVVAAAPFAAPPVVEPTFGSPAAVAPDTAPVAAPVITPGSGSRFVRIEENSDPDDFEPVVIFPSQQKAAASPFGHPRIEVDEAEIATSSPFAAGSHMPAQPAAPNGDAAANSATRADADEMDQALKAALATLQRMTATG